MDPNELLHEYLLDFY